MATADSADGPTHLHPFHEQEPFLREDHTYYGYISGVGAGKTFAGILRIVLNVEHWNPGEMHAIVAPTTTMIKDVIIPQMREVGLLDHWDYKGPHSDEPGLHAPNGARILLLSADNSRTIERLAGLNLASWWLDEASRVPERALEILTQRLRVGEYRNGFVTTTPMGQDHIYDFFVGDVDGEESHHGEADLYVSDDRLSILHVPTWANPHTPQDYKEQMENKEGQVYEREILGRFVDYEGLVYGWFDRETHVRPPDADDLPTERIRSHIYGVDWGFNNPSVCLCIGVGTDDHWIVRDEIYQSGLTTQEFADAVGDMQQEYGVGRVYCDPAEPASIETFQRAGLDATGAENDIMPGIQLVSEKRGGLHVSERCPNLIDEFGTYRYPDGGDGENPVDANNHACFPAGTTVQTDRGQVPIESVSAGDYALTRAGYRPVVSSGKTQDNADLIRTTFSDGTELVSTPNHPIFTDSNRYVNADALRYGDICQKIKSSTTAEPTTETSGDTTGHSTTTGRTVTGGFTGTSGATTTARFPTAILFTTKTATRLTTTSTTSNASQQRNTPNTMTGAATGRHKPQSKRRKSGTNQTRGPSGTRNTGTRVSERCLKTPRPRSATNAEMSLNIIPAPGSVQTPVKQSTGENPASTTRSEPVKRANKRSQSTNTATHEAVRVVAQERLCRGQSVYNLSVAGPSEYYANGILVHNCDALRYALFTHDQQGDLNVGVAFG